MIVKKKSLFYSNDFFGGWGGLFVFETGRKLRVGLLVKSVHE